MVSHRSGWTKIFKKRRAMIRPGRDKLHGIVEVGETLVGGEDKGGKRGRGAQRKSIFLSCRFFLTKSKFLSKTLTAMSLKLDNQVFHLSELYVLRKKGDMAVITKEEK